MVPEATPEARDWHAEWSQGDRAVVVEQDERVAYAYLLERGAIVGDVWLYNVTMAPERAEWLEPAPRMPFRNPVTNCSADGESHQQDEFDVRWGALGAEIYLGTELAGRIWPGAKPGQAGRARRRSPIADVLTSQWPDLPRTTPGA